MLISAEGQTGEGWKLAKKHCCFGNRATLGTKVSLSPSQCSAPSTDFSLQPEQSTPGTLFLLPANPSPSLLPTTRRTRWHKLRTFSRAVSFLFPPCYPLPLQAIFLNRRTAPPVTTVGGVHSVPLPLGTQCQMTDAGPRVTVFISCVTHIRRLRCGLCVWSFAVHKRNSILIRAIACCSLKCRSM